MTAVQTPGEKLTSGVENKDNVWKVVEKLSSFAVDEENAQKYRCEFEVRLKERCLW